ncbi:glycerol-3-phosphate cytidylyltransferase [Bradyrhizobium sp. 62]|uniref:glycerol-3-phosphate cytidylyltransferase n=1 Tax=Bradyrhizobium sp. 62 TaxID=1043588 RepID=UPI001FFAD74F|nr:glycerol-3-phosphate cytidylyltransferase [Bradyrhizobium sp. 62]MCK1368317.1 glycerol-3-phosphate cytidylyltransferase [Bradyrhizobium sp. 62]
MTVVITYGTFDLFHVGHVRLLQRLRSLGDRLIVACSTDEFNAIKGKKSVFSYKDRAEILSSCKYVDLVIPEENWEQKVTDVQKYNVGIFAMGDDWAGKFDYLSTETGCIVSYLSRTSDVSTTDIKGYLRKIDDDTIASLKNTVDRLRAQLEKY